ncbi:hypothetical protein [Actinomadura nitritigenes]|nr:hypothetical protein [Actinomadura nitritigenes]
MSVVLAGQDRRRATAAGAIWDELAAVLDISPDTAARRYRAR